MSLKACHEIKEVGFLVCGALYDTLETPKSSHLHGLKPSSLPFRHAALRSVRTLLR